MPKVNDVVTVSLSMMKVMSPLVYDVVSSLAEMSKKTSGVVEEGNIDKMTDEAKKQEVRTQIALEQMKIVQELAIAKRIETADEVEIEEYYDNNIKGNMGLKGEDTGISLGISGSNQKVVKRIYKFKGYNEAKEEAYNQVLSNLNNVVSSDSNGGKSD